MLGTIIVDHALIPLFFFFLFSWLLTVFFYRKTAHDRAQDDMEQSPQRYALISFFFVFFDYLLSVYRITAHDQAMDDREWSPQRYTGHDHNDHALYLFFFFFSNTYCLFTGKLPMFRLMMTWNHPHKGMPFFLSFFWILINRKTAHIWAHDDMELSPQRYARHDHNDHALFSFLFLNTYSFYRKTAHVQARNDMELSPPRYAGHDCYDHALFPFFFFEYLLFFTGKLPMFRLTMTWNHPHQGMPLFLFLNSYCFFTGKQPMIGLVMTWNCLHQGMLGTIITIVPFFFLSLFFFLNTRVWHRWG